MSGNNNNNNNNFNNNNNNNNNNNCSKGSWSGSSDFCSQCHHQSCASGSYPSSGAKGPVFNTFGSTNANNNNCSGVGGGVSGQSFSVPPIQVTAKVLFGSVSAISALNAERKKKAWKWADGRIFNPDDNNQPAVTLCFTCTSPTTHSMQQPFTFSSGREGRRWRNLTQRHVFAIF